MRQLNITEWSAFLTSRRHFAASSLALRFAGFVALLAGCGGQQGPPPPVEDFTLTVSPASASVVVGNTTPAILVSINPQNGFAGMVNISLQGIPAGVTAIPSASFSVGAGATQSVAFLVSDWASVGASSITILATSGKLSHSTQLSLTAEARVQTYQIGSVLYLESGTAADTSRIGLETMWGGSIVEVSLNGTNFINRHDTGREVQLSFRDGNVPTWNPTLGGDDFDQGTPTVAYTLASDSLYTKARPLQWYAESYGGGAGQPVAGDMLVEQTINAVKNQPHTFIAHYKVTHLGNDLHADVSQEFPAVYTNKDYNRFIYYGGTAPWTGGALTVTQFPNLPSLSPYFYVSEHWGALVNTQNMGLTVYVPSQYPYVLGFAAPSPGPGGPTDDATNYFAPLGNFTIGPNFVLEGDIYLIAGNCGTARQIADQLHQSLSTPDIFTPTGALDVPSPGSTVSGVTSVNGWTFDDVKVSSVEILVDGVVDGMAVYGSPRDVTGTYPHAPANIEYSYSLATTKYHNGTHILNTRVTDSSGNVAVFADVAVTISN